MSSPGSRLTLDLPGMLLSRFKIQCLAVQQVKDPALSLLRHRFDPWPRNFHMPWTQPNFFFFLNTVFRSTIAHAHGLVHQRLNPASLLVTKPVTPLP